MYETTTPIAGILSVTENVSSYPCGVAIETSSKNLASFFLHSLQSSVVYAILRPREFVATAGMIIF